MNNKNKGFTIIELIVVIAIISVLAAIVLTNVNGYMAKARDARRKADLKSLVTALEIFYTSSGHYPIVTNNTWQIDCTMPSHNWINDSGNYDWSAGILTQPHDPVDNNCTLPFSTADSLPSASYGYWSDNGQRYILAARLENGSDPSTIGHNDILYFDGLFLHNSIYAWNGRTYVIRHP